jgi:hypothetical protein
MNIEKYNKLHDEIMKRLENGEITIETAREVNDLAFEKYMYESKELKIISSDEHGYHIVDHKFHGLNIEILAIDEERKVYTLDKLQKSLNVLNKFDKIEDEVFTDYVKLSEEWEMKNIKTKNDLKKLATLDYIRFSAYKDRSDKEYDSKYEIWYNSKYTSDTSFFGGHSLIITIYIKNNKFVKYKSQLAG